MNFTVFRDPNALGTLISTLARGIAPTMVIFFMTILIAVILGVMLAAALTAKNPLFNRPVAVYIYVMRSTPLMLQLLFAYFILSKQNWTPFLTFLFGDKRAQFPMRCIIMMFSLNYAAYFAEIFRGGIQAFPAGQKEAAQVLGMTKTQCFFRVQLPQVIKNVMPSLTNEFVTLVKDTSIAKVISVGIDQRTILVIAEKQVSALASVEPYLIVLLFFLVFNGAVEQGCRLIERKLAYYR